jgi:hypothetical protein
VKGYSAKDIIEELLPFYRKNCLSSKTVYNWVEKSVQRIPKFKSITEQIYFSNCEVDRCNNPSRQTGKDR